ncbi:MAG: hypothetical protein RDV41_09200 [Planctomycetota bacterium]|nr:hypothetical protein [Planctomycetota bacterium]
MRLSLLTLLILAGLFALIACKEPNMAVIDKPARTDANTGTVVLGAYRPDTVKIRANRTSIVFRQAEDFPGRVRLELTDKVLASETSTLRHYRSDSFFTFRIDNLLVETKELLMERQPTRVITGRGMVLEGDVLVTGSGGGLTARQAWVELAAMDFARVVELRFAFDVDTGASGDVEKIVLEVYDVADISAGFESIEKLAERIKIDVQPETWRLPGRSVTVASGCVVVRASAEEHKAVNAYLKTLREPGK